MFQLFVPKIVDKINSEVINLFVNVSGLVFGLTNKLFILFMILSDVFFIVTFPEFYSV